MIGTNPDVEVSGAIEIGGLTPKVLYFVTLCITI